jgi:hypothetical protein
MASLGSALSLPDIGPGKYPAEKYQTIMGSKAHVLSVTARPSAFAFGTEPKFFTVGETPSNAYKRSLGPGSYSLPDGFKPTQAARLREAAALKDLKSNPVHWANDEFTKMTMRDARRGPGYTKEYVATPEQLKAIDAMLGKNSDRRKDLEDGQKAHPMHTKEKKESRGEQVNIERQLLKTVQQCIDNVPEDVDRCYDKYYQHYALRVRKLKQKFGKFLFISDSALGKEILNEDLPRIDRIRKEEAIKRKEERMARAAAAAKTTRGSITS